MYNEEYEKKYIETTSCSDGDCLIFHVDTDLYDDDSLIELEKEFKEKMPNVKIIFVPNDLIDNITHIKNFGFTTSCVNINGEDTDGVWSKLK